MRVLSILKFGFSFLFISLLLVGCSTDPDSEMKKALRDAVNIYYGESYEEDIKPAMEQIRQAVINGANPNAVYDGTPALYLAIMENDVKLASVLLEQGADVSAQDLDKDGEVDYLPLLTAIGDVNEVDPDMIGLLIKAGAPVNGKGHFEAPLTAAVDVGSMDTVKLLLQAGADVNPKGYEEWSSPLEVAVSDGDIEMYDFLRTSGAEIRDAGILLTVAAGSRKPDLVERILPLYSGPKGDLQVFEMAAYNLLYDRYEEKEEYEARMKDTKSVMQRLRAAGFAPAADEFTPVMLMAAKTADMQALETMLSYGASATAAEDSGETCLMLVIKATSLGNMMESEIGAKGMFKHQDTHSKEVVKLLLDKGADVNAQDKRGRTALMHAATSFNVTAVRQLLEKGADKNLVDEKGNTAEQQMLAIGLLKDNKKDKAGRMMGAFFGITPELRAQARERAGQIQVEFGSEPTVLTNPPSPPPSSPQDDAKPIAKPG
jgi:ankyrin repeat protein